MTAINGYWQSVFGLAALVAGFCLAKKQKDEFLYRREWSTRFYWLGVLSFGLSLLPLGVFLADQFRPGFIWGLIGSGSVSLGSIGKTIWDVLQKQKPPDIQKTLPKLLLCVVGISIGFTARIALDRFHSPAPKLHQEHIRT